MPGPTSNDAVFSTLGNGCPFFDDESECFKMAPVGSGENAYNLTTGAAVTIGSSTVVQVARVTVKLDLGSA